MLGAAGGPVERLQDDGSVRCGIESVERGVRSRCSRVREFEGGEHRTSTGVHLGQLVAVCDVDVAILEQAHDPGVVPGARIRASGDVHQLRVPDGLQRRRVDLGHEGTDRARDVAVASAVDVHMLSVLVDHVVGRRVLVFK